MRKILAVALALVVSTASHAGTDHPAYAKFAAAGRCARLASWVIDRDGRVSAWGKEHRRLWGIMMKHGREWASLELQTVQASPSADLYEHIFASPDFTVGGFFADIYRRADIAVRAEMEANSLPGPAVAEMLFQADGCRGLR